MLYVLTGDNVQQLFCCEIMEVKVCMNKIRNGFKHDQWDTLWIFIFRYWYTLRNNFDYRFNFSWLFFFTSWQERAGYNFCLLCLFPNWPATDVTGNMTSDLFIHLFVKICKIFSSFREVMNNTDTWRSVTIDRAWIDSQIYCTLIERNYK